MVLEACKTTDNKPIAPTDKASVLDEDDRMVEEKALNKKLREEVFFTPAEMATIGILADIIIPKDEVSGSATEAKVPDFIEFIVKDSRSTKRPCGVFKVVANGIIKKIRQNLLLILPQRNVLKLWMI